MGDVKNRKCPGMAAILLTCLMILCVFAPASVLAQSNDGAIASWSDLQAALSRGGEIKLTKSITAQAGDSALTVPAGVKVTLDLNGYNIDRGLYDSDTGSGEPAEDGYVIKNEGMLTITDSGSKGVIKGGNNSSPGKGGGIYNKKQLVLQDGAIYGNKAIDGAGVYNDSNAAFIMTGGYIGFNEARQRGGAVGNSGEFILTGGEILLNAAPKGCGVWNAGTFRMTGGTIRQNSGGTSGGGVYADSGNAEIRGGSITDNHVQEGSGIYVLSGITEISGGSITGNGSAGSNRDDVYLDNVREDSVLKMRGKPEVGELFLETNKVITVTGAFENGVDIGVSSKTGDGKITSGYSTYNTAEPKQYIHALDSSKNIVMSDGEAMISGGVGYIERRWDEATKQVVSNYKVTGKDVKPVPANGNMTSGWYYLDRNVTKDGRIESINGDVNLILGDGCTLDVKGLYVPSAWKLTIYGQREGTGKIYSHPSGGAGIGGYKNHDNGNIVIHGGTIDAKGYDHCAGIGSNDDCRGGYINIFGGTIKATGGNDGAGIGGGEDCDSGDINIYGGDLDVTAGNNAAGIGGGENGDSEHINIYGGNIEVTSRDGAAIGGAEDGDGGYTTISGGKLELHSGNGAGIGGGNKAGDGGHITITGGDITIHSENGAGIGGGRAPTGFTEKNSGDGGTIRISGDTTKIDITADEGYCIGAGDAATGKGHGSGNSIGSGGNVRIDGGELTLKGKSGVSNQACIGGDTGHFEMYGGNINGGQQSEASSYLFWYIGNAEVEIYGGTLSGSPVRMKEDDYYGDDEKMHPCSIFKMTGGELHLYNTYTQRKGIEAYQITLSDDIMVKQGNKEDEQEPVPAADRVKTVNAKTNYYVTIKTCDHPNAKYSVYSEYRHSVTCSNCKTKIDRELHNWDGNGKCTKCNYQADDLTVTFDPDNGDDPISVAVPRGNKVSKPADPFKRGYVFEGWYKLVNKQSGRTEENAFDFDSRIEEDITLVAQWTTRWTELQNTIDSTSNGGTVTLGCDYTAGRNDTALVIREGTTITINLNGFTIDRANPRVKGVQDSSVIIVENNANLTVTDGGEDGMITGGSCGGVVVNGGTFTLSGGSIIGNTNEDYGGGVVVSNGGTFSMTGGSIRENSTDGETGGDGGGVYMFGDTTFNMSGGVIKGNSCSGRGGGVYMLGSRTFSMTGGSISNNICGSENGGGGVYLSGSSTLRLSGKPTITGNTAYVKSGGSLSAGPEPNDVYLLNNSKKISITGALDENAQIGVSVPDASYTGNVNPFTSGLSGKGTAENFLSNNAQYVVLVNSNKEAYLVKADEILTVTFDRNDGSEKEESFLTVKKGEKVKDPGTPVREGYTFKGWYQVIRTESETTLTDNAFDFDTPITEDITLKAVWEEIEWNDPTYEWADNNETVTATRVSKGASPVTQTEIVDAQIQATRAATCTEKGETVYVSGVFNNQAFEIQTRTVDIDPLGHEPKSEAEKRNFKEASCTQDGSYDLVTVCERCGEDLSIEHKTIPAKGHDWGEWTVTKPATCEVKGTETRTCSHDASHTETREIAATGHNWGEWIETKAATETEEGEETRTCRNDSTHTETRSIPVTAHVHNVSKVDAVPASCTENGNIEYYVCNKGYKPCGRYFKVDSDASAEAQVKIEYNGTEISAVEINHEETLIPATGHNWGEGNVTKEPECTEKGEMTYICTVCGKTKTEDIDNTLHHNEDVTEVILEPGCETSGYHWNIRQCTVCGEVMTSRLVRDEALGHDWGEWTVTKAASVDEEGEETRTCSRCGEIETRATPKVEPGPAPDPSGGGDGPSPAPDPSGDGDDPAPEPDPSGDGDDPAPEPAPVPDGRGEDGTAVGPGASAETAEEAIIDSASEEGPEGTRFAPLRLRSLKQTKKSIRLTWNKAKGAGRYVIYGNLCGRKMKKIGSTTKLTRSVTKIAGSKLKKGRYYKFIIVALDDDDKVVTTSKVIHVAARGGKAGNHKSVRVSKTVVAKAKKLKKGGTLKLNARAVKASGLSVKKHRPVCYVSTDPEIATVSSKGTVKAVKKGSCYIYAYAQDGVFRKIRITVK